MKLALLLASLLTFAAEASDLTGAWEHVRQDGTTGVGILTDSHFSIAWYVRDPAKFVSTEGGTWKTRSLEFQYEITDGAWHHIGKSTGGDPMHEVWNRRETLGI